MSKNDGLEKAIVKCSRLIKACNKSTQSLLGYAQEGSLDRCDSESRNRDRLIKIIKKEYREIKKKAALEKGEYLKLFNDWDKEFHLFARISEEKDREILHVLQGARKDLQKAIASVYKMRKKIQRYNPNNV